MADKKCTSCNASTLNDSTATIFPCPSCGKEISRCGHCRKTAVKYKCPNCGFEGP